MEDGPDVGGGEDAVAAVGGDFPVNGGTGRAVGGRVQLADLSVFLVERAAFLAADVHERDLRPVTAVCGVAVDAGAFCDGIVGQEPGLEAFDVAFFDAEHIPDLIGRLDQPVAQVAVQAVGRNRPLERRKPGPLFPVPGVEREAERAAGLRLQHRLPCLHREAELRAAGTETVGLSADDFEAERIRTFDFEVQRGDVAREGDVRIVRHHRSGAAGRRAVLPAPAGCQEQDKRDIGQGPFHCPGCAYL